MELDKDLAARQEARLLCQQAEKAQATLSQMSQQQLDAIVQAIAQKFSAAAVELAELAVRETGFGNPDDKVVKNRFASETVAAAVRDMKTVGVLNVREKEKLWEVGVPVGVIAAIVPSTNPTSTVCYKAIIALKSGNTIVFSPHPKALECTLRAARIVAAAAEGAGAPPGSISCLSMASMAGCQELMGAEQVRLILATGGPGMVRAAYSSGKPAIGVGAGNGPAYIHHSADVAQALSCICKSKSFDYGTVCASEQSIIVEKSMENAVREEGKRQGFYFMSTNEAGSLAKLLFKPNGTLNPAIVGRPATALAEMAGFSVPRETKVLVAREQEAGPTRPYSMEKLCPVLAFFVMDSEDAVLAKAIEVLKHEGSGHTFAMHAQDEAVIRRFALQIPVSRFLVNTPAALGGIGATTGLFPALTLGCGAVGGSSSSNNISPLDLINIRRVAWGQESRKTPEVRVQVDEDLVERIAAKILERLK
ncbi:MAG: acetaldehyde dehydrogenase (acetylating) [Oscillospiraceae bacterium]|nr:acetaldehyde dehydrogenase (acetylating) [Oscillospiraceae bacterium]MBQ4600654.1 acetaldehyde dehydrogenase (acetylating) [Oscillospiraceae bacterium]